MPGVATLPPPSDAFRASPILLKARTLESGALPSMDNPWRAQATLAAASSAKDLKYPTRRVYMGLSTLMEHKSLWLDSALNMDSRRAFVRAMLALTSCGN